MALTIGDGRSSRHVADGKYIFCTRHRHIDWVSAKILNEMRKDALR